MAFLINEVRTGVAKTFSAKEILLLIGDAINDEIIIGGEVYRISSCQEINTGLVDGVFVMDWISRELEVRFDHDTVFYIPDIIVDKESAFLTVNNVLYSHGIESDYHIEGDRIYWHGGFDLEPTDKLVVRYPLIIS